MQISSTVRSAMADAFETQIGTSARLLVFAGTLPAIGSSASGTLLADMTLPADWLSAASSGEKSLLGTWTDSSANAGGTASVFQIWNSTLGFVGCQGVIAATTTGDMQFSNVTVSSGLAVTVTSFTVTMPTS